MLLRTLSAVNSHRHSTRMHPIRMHPIRCLNSLAQAFTYQLLVCAPDTHAPDTYQLRVCTRNTHAPDTVPQLAGARLLHISCLYAPDTHSPDTYQLRVCTRYGASTRWRTASTYQLLGLLLYTALVLVHASRQTTSACVSIRQHTCVSIRLHTSAHVRVSPHSATAYACNRCVPRLAVLLYVCPHTCVSGAYESLIRIGASVSSSCFAVCVPSYFYVCVSIVLEFHSIWRLI
jgi:hypothetical protein